MQYYQEHYPGVSSEELRHIDHGLYRRLRQDALLPEPATLSASDLLARYRERYSGLTCGQLQKANQALYRQFQKRNLLQLLPRQRRRIGDPWQFYLTHYEGVSRKDLAHRDNYLYQLLGRHGMLKRVPESNSP